MRAFYIKYFACRAGEKYRNPKTSFESYFLDFGEGARLELMAMPGIPGNRNDAHEQYLGLIHLAVKLAGPEEVDALTARLKGDGYAIVSEPRRTGDGYYESCVLDPEGNRVEIVA